MNDVIEFKTRQLGVSGHRTPLRVLFAIVRLSLNRDCDTPIKSRITTAMASLVFRKLLTAAQKGSLTPFTNSFRDLRSFSCREHPIFLLQVLLALMAIFKSYPCYGDTVVYLALLPLWRHSFACEQKPVITRRALCAHCRGRNAVLCKKGR